MTDPVRPVAPREVIRILAAINKMRVGHLGGREQLDKAEVLALFQRQGCACQCCDHAEGSDCACDCHADGDCAAAPVPCAASPADPLEIAARELVGLMINLDEKMQVLWCGLCNRRDGLKLHDESCVIYKLQSALETRATGEGARDAVTGLPTVPVPPIAAAEELAAVAVSREELIEALEAYGAHDIDECAGHPDTCTCGLDELLARLRGEATVRPEKDDVKICTFCAKGQPAFYLQSGTGNLWHRNEAGQLYKCIAQIAKSATVRVEE